MDTTKALLEFTPNSKQSQDIEKFKWLIDAMQLWELRSLKVTHKDKLLEMFLRNMKDEKIAELEKLSERSTVVLVTLIKRKKNQPLTAFHLPVGTSGNMISKSVAEQRAKKICIMNWIVWDLDKKTLKRFDSGKINLKDKKLIEEFDKYFRLLVDYDNPMKVKW